jgi:8-oxo-dGTP pyrophosphatase MutT (NUDIX family)
VGEEHVLAAGGVVFRRAPNGDIEVAIIHRPRYDDWTLPKGKLESGETLEDAAVREVAEETGIAVERGDEITRIRYRDRHGRPKEVTYYLMTPTGGTFAPNDEVDELRWLSVPDALTLLSNESDRDVVTAASHRM